MYTPKQHAVLQGVRAQNVVHVKVYNDQTNKISPIIQFPFEAARGREFLGKLKYMVRSVIQNESDDTHRKYARRQIWHFRIEIAEINVFLKNLLEIRFGEAKRSQQQVWGAGLGKVFLDSPRFSPRLSRFLLDSFLFVHVFLDSPGPHSSILLGPSSILPDSFGSLLDSPQFPWLLEQIPLANSSNRLESQRKS